MKKSLVYIVLLFGICVMAQTPKEIFSKANAMYQQGKYENAATLYLTIEKEGLASDDLYFNLGNSYYKLNKIASAIYYYEKALKLNPDNKNAANNLGFAKRMSIDIIEAIPSTFFQRFTEQIILKYSYDVWAIFAVIASFLTAILFLMYYFSYSPRKKLFLFNAAIGIFFIWLVSFIFAINNYKTTQNTQFAIIFDSKVEVKNAPSYKSDNAFELHEGTKVLLLSKLDNWQEIKIADGKTGWIQLNSFKVI